MGEGQDGDGHDGRDLEPGEQDLHGAAQPDAKVIEGGQKENQPDGAGFQADRLERGDGAQPGDVQGHRLQGRSETREPEKITQRIGKNVGDRGNRAGLDDDEHRPAVEVADEIVVGFVEVDVLAAGLMEDAEISAMLSAPNRVITPATTQTRISSVGEPSCEAISPGFLKMPEPMTTPMAKAMAAIRPICRSSSTGFFSRFSSTFTFLCRSA